MATPIIRFTSMLRKEDEQHIIDEIKKRRAEDGMIMIPPYCELVGVIQDNGTFMPYVKDGMYTIPESKALMNG